MRRGWRRLLREYDNTLISKKYPGKEIEEIPSGYLTWLLEQDWIYEEKHKKLLEAIEYEMAVRDRSDGHFYEEGG